MIQIGDKIDDLAMINYWLIVDIIMIVLKYPYKRYGKRLIQSKINDRNIYTLYKLQKKKLRSRKNFHLKNE